MIATARPRTRHPLALRLQCRKEWVEGQGTLAEVAQRHNVPEQTLVAWYRREHWTAARNRWHEKQLSDNEAPAKPPTFTPNPENAHDARAHEYDLDIQRLRQQLEAEKDPVKSDRWCAAIAKLENVYRCYAGVSDSRRSRYRYNSAPRPAVPMYASTMPGAEQSQQPVRPDAASEPGLSPVPVAEPAPVQAQVSNPITPRQNSGSNPAAATTVAGPVPASKPEPPLGPGEEVIQIEGVSVRAPVKRRGGYHFA